MLKDCKVAIFSDLHLGVHTNSSTWHDISLEWAQWYTAQLKSRNITDIIFCGDFFHNRSEITVNTLHHASKILQLFDDFRLIMITGNHDSFFRHNSKVNSISIFNGRKNIEVIQEPKVLQVCGREMYFAPWGTDVNEIHSCDIVFGHFEIESFKMNTYKICDHGTKPDDLFKHSPLIVSGHFHLREERKYGKNTILYVGCPFELDFGDVDSVKGFYILDLKTMLFEFIENNFSPKHKKIKLSELIKIDNFDRKGKDILGNNIIKLVVDRNIDSTDLDKLSVKLNSFKPVTLTVDHSANFDKFDLGQEKIDLSGVNIPQAISEFIDMLDIQNKKDVVDYTVSLYNNCK